MVTFQSFFQLQEFIYQWTKVRWERFCFFWPREYGPQQYSLIGTRKIQYLQTEGAHTVLGIGGWTGSALKARRRLSGSPSSGPFSEYVRLQNCVSCTSYTKSPFSLSCCLTAWYFKSLGRFGDWNTFFNLGATKITLVYLAFRDQTFF